jgi:hypothetical protein
VFPLKVKKEEKEKKETEIAANVFPQYHNDRFVGDQRLTRNLE